MTVSANVKRGWLHHPKKESICLNIGSKEYNSALDNGYVRNLTEIDEEYFNPEKEEITKEETREVRVCVKRIAELEAILKEKEQSESTKRIAELEASLKEKEFKRLQAEEELEASAKRIAELEASLKEKKQSKKV